MRLRYHFIDETGFNVSMHKSYGWEKRGNKLMSNKSLIKSKNYSLISGINADNICYSQIIEGGVRSADFYYFILMIIQDLKLYDKKYVLMADNCPVHKSRFYDKISNIISMEFLPKYSPWLNPIETYFSFLKRKPKNETFTNVDELLIKLKNIIVSTNSNEIISCNKSIYKYIKKSLQFEDIIN